VDEKLRVGGVGKCWQGPTIAAKQTELGTTLVELRSGSALATLIDFNPALVQVFSSFFSTARYHALSGINATLSLHPSTPAQDRNQQQWSQQSQLHTLHRDQSSS